jgi:diguanylate cyclase
MALGSLFTPWQAPAFLFVGATTTVALVVSVCRRRPSLVWPWIFIAIAFALFLVGGVTRTSYHTLGNLTATRSAIPDVISLPGYFFLAIGLLGFSRSRVRGAAHTSIVLDALIAAFALFTLAWALVIGPVLLEQQAPLLVKIVLTAYPSMSIFLVVVTLRMVFIPNDKRATSLRLCVGAMILMFVGDALFMIADINLLTVPPAVLDLPYALAMLGAGATAVHPSMQELTEPGPATRLTTSPGRTALVAAALLVSAVLAAQYREFTPADRVVTSVLFFALTAAVVLRIVQALRIAARSEALLAFQANHDELTGLPNRRMLEEHLSKLLEAASLDRTHVALLFLDLDRFKLVNDTLGHTRGDDFLVQVAQRLASYVRPSDLVARIGGDEFVILLNHPVTTSQAVGMANRLLHCLKEPIILDGIEFYISGSIGLAFACGDDPHAVAEALIRDADTALYQAKEAGRDKVAVFDESMRDQVEERAQLERDLHNAILHEQFHLVYQPIVGLPRGPSVGMEALIRWAHPTRGVLSPAQFIPVAEDIGKIAEIGNWVMEEAVSQFATWRRQVPEMENVYVAVNLSSAQLRDDGIVDRVADLLVIHGLPGSCLCLEVTESMAMQDPIASAAILARLRRLGVGIALDDFGAEYSSLAYLKRLPVTMLKIDKSFVDSLVHEDTADSSLIAAVVAMAKSLGITTVAEGVETSDQAHRLLGLGVDAVQGFLYSRPVAADRLVEVVASLGERRLTLVTASVC